MLNVLPPTPDKLPSLQKDYEKSECPKKFEVRSRLIFEKKNKVRMEYSIGSEDGLHEATFNLIYDESGSNIKKILYQAYAANMPTNQLEIKNEEQSILLANMITLGMYANIFS